MATLELDMYNPAELDMYVRLVLSEEQARHQARSLSVQLARAVLAYGPDTARADAHYAAGETGLRIAERVITYLAAIRTERTRYWQVSFTEHGREQKGAMIKTAERTRAQYGWAVDRVGPDAVRITEYTDTLTSVPVDPDNLPHDDHHQLPRVPGAAQVARFYRFDGEGPAAVDAAAVAYVRQHLRAARHRSFALPPTLLDTVRVVMAREVTRDEVAPPVS